MPDDRARFWICTLSADVNWVPGLPDGARYCKGQLERGEGGYLHWQFYVVYDPAVRFRQVVNALPPSCHIERSRSPAAEAYVWKDDTAVPDTRFEFGEKVRARGNANDWDDIRRKAANGDFDAIPSGIYLRYRRALHDIYAAAQQVDDVEREVVVYWGDSGTGKSHRAFQEARAEGREKVYVKDPVTKWWDGYDPQKHEYVVVDEYEGGWSIGHFLRWTDKWASDCEVKGGRLPFLAKKIWFTSNVDPMQWYEKATEQQRAALRRRCRITHFSEPFRREVVVIED